MVCVGAGTSRYRAVNSSLASPSIQTWCSSLDSAVASGGSTEGFETALRKWHPAGLFTFTPRPALGETGSGGPVQGPAEALPRGHHHCTHRGEGAAPPFSRSAERTGHRGPISLCIVYPRGAGRQLIPFLESCPERE